MPVAHQQRLPALRHWQPMAGEPRGPARPLPRIADGVPVLRRPSKKRPFAALSGLLLTSRRAQPEREGTAACKSVRGWPYSVRGDGGQRCDRVTTAASYQSAAMVRIRATRHELGSNSLRCACRGKSCPLLRFHSFSWGVPSGVFTICRVASQPIALGQLVRSCALLTPRRAELGRIQVGYNAACMRRGSRGRRLWPDGFFAYPSGGERGSTGQAQPRPSTNNRPSSRPRSVTSARAARADLYTGRGVRVCLTAENRLTTIRQRTCENR